MEDETTTTLWDELTALLNIDGEERLTPSHLDPHGFNTFMGERYPSGGLQVAAFQYFMECKRGDLVWENGRPHGRRIAPTLLQP